MNPEAREKLSRLVQEAANKAGGQRAYSRKLGVSLIAVQGWIECKSVPTLENLLLIADNTGFTLDELLAYLGITSSPSNATYDQVLKLIMTLPRDELVRVIEASARILASPI